MLSIVDGKIDVEKIGELDATYDDFLVDIKKMDGDKKDCRFAGKGTKCSDIIELEYFSFSLRLRVHFPARGHK